MARAFGRGSRFPSGGSCTSNKREVGRKGRAKQHQKTTKKKCGAPLKAGRGKAQGPESGSSKESSPPSKPTSSSKFKVCRRRRRRRSIFEKIYLKKYFESLIYAVHLIKYPSY
jgi:hypothetical protein